jgi:hypothetical protein
VNLEPVALSQTNPVGMHTAMTPEDGNIIARNVTDPFVPGITRLVADSSFETDDTNNDGRIDRVTVSMVIGRFDTARRETVRQTLRQTIVLGNTR